MGSTDQVTFANTVLIIVMGIMLILIVIGLGLFAYRYQRVQQARRQQDAANLTALRFEIERAKAASKEELSEQVGEPASEAASEVEPAQVPRRSARTPSENAKNLPGQSLR